MSTQLIVGIIIAAGAVVVCGVWYAMARQHLTSALREQYGSEYDRTVRHARSRRIAEAQLVKRQERVDHFQIRPLLAEQRELFDQQWHDVSQLFVDDPGSAVQHADALVTEVMRARGYPVANFEQRASDLSVHHAEFVRSYRAAREIADRHKRGAATTEELRRAMIYYHQMFDDLLGEEWVTAADRPVEMTVAREVAPPPPQLERGRDLTRPRPSIDSFPADDEVR
jgi:hypothetical protein